MDYTTEAIAIAEKAKDSYEQKTVPEAGQYSIYNYFKEHSAFLIACISGLVAVMSFVFNYAIIRYNDAYLRYWNIDTIYGNGDNASQLYIVFCSFLYCLAILLIHGLMSKTSDVYRHYNRLTSALGWQQRIFRKTQQKIVHKEKKLLRQLKKLLKDDTQGKVEDAINAELARVREKMPIYSDTLATLRKAKRECSIWVHINVLLSVFFSIFIGVVFVLLAITDTAEITFLHIGFVVLIIIIFVFLAYFIPAYFTSRITKTQYENMDWAEFAEDILNYKSYMFPIYDLASNGLKSVLTNKKLVLAAAQFIIAILFCIGTFSVSGTSNAEKKRDFPIYTDEMGTYAVIYNNGESLVMEAVKVDGIDVEIDITRQRIIPANNVAYEIYSFENVTVVGGDGS